MLNRELNRMQHIDRIKVHNARTSFYNPETGSLLPTVDTLHAATTVQSPSIGGADPISFDLGSSMPAAYGQTQSLTREIITNNELKGQCERLNSRPSMR